MENYAFRKEIDASVEEIVKRVTASLEKEEFGIVSRIDMHEKFKEKLNKPFRKYVILGTCNPPFAFRAITAEPLIGLMLPCNVVIQEREKANMVAFIRPSVSMNMIDNPGLRETAAEVELKLQRAFENV